MAPLQPDVLPARPAQQHGIGIIGAGGIVRYGHLPAYRRAGWPVVGIASRREEAVRAVQQEWEIPVGVTEWRALLDLPAVEVVDVAYPFDEERLEIVREAASRGKHILMQKPLAHSLEVAEEMVHLAAQHGVILAVNQNARWCPQYRAAQWAVAQGLLGELFSLAHVMHNNQDAQPWFHDRWYAQQPRFQILEYAVHHLDLMRFWTAMEPTRVSATIGRKPGQLLRGEMLASITLAFPNGAVGTLIENNAAHPGVEPTSYFRLDGVHGMVDGYAMGPVGFRLFSDRLDDAVQELTLPSSWFPDAFIGTMGELLLAIEEHREPSISARDNLNTLRLVFAAYADAECVEPEVSPFSIML